MLILRAADHRCMPWKNGGGVTTEIAVHPAGAGLDDFIWRLSAASVARSGPFSLFADVDRTLAVTGGDGLRLRSADETITLDTRSAPYRFAADVQVDADLVGGPVTDLNVMTRRGRADHRMKRLTVEGPASVTLAGTPSLLVCAAGTVTIADEGRLAVGDCAVTPAPRLKLAGAGLILLAEILAAR